MYLFPRTKKIFSIVLERWCSCGSRQWGFGRNLLKAMQPVQMYVFLKCLFQAHCAVRLHRADIYKNHVVLCTDQFNIIILIFENVLILFLVWFSNQIFPCFRSGVHKLLLCFQILLKIIVEKNKNSYVVESEYS